MKSFSFLTILLYSLLILLVTQQVSAQQSQITRKIFSDSGCSTNPDSNSTFLSGVCQTNTAGINENFQTVKSFLITCRSVYGSTFTFKTFSTSSCLGSPTFETVVANSSCSSYTSSGIWETFSSACDGSEFSRNNGDTSVGATIGLAVGVGGGVLVLIILSLVFFKKIKRFCCSCGDHDDVIVDDGVVPNNSSRPKKGRKYQTTVEENEMA